jgi:hypothetical protein
MSDYKKATTLIATFRLAAILLVMAASDGMAQKAGPPPVLSRIVAIEYPWLARLAVLEGTVELVATISPKGNVESVRIISGPEPLARASAATISKWLFTCEGSSGCEIAVAVTFTLTGSCAASEQCPSEFEMDLPDKVSVKSKSILAIVD